MMSEKNPILNQNIEDVVFSIFDTETTGDNVKREDRPIEIAVVHWNLKKGFLAKPWQTLINPQMPIHPAAIAVHGLMDEDVENQPLLEDVLPTLHDYIKDTILVAHNINFDLNMLPTLREKDNVQIDSLRFVRQIYKIEEPGYKEQKLSSHKMQELRYWLNLKVDTMGLDAHRAAADILVTGEVFRETVLRFLERSQCTKVSELIDFINAPMMIEKMPLGKYKGIPVAEAVAKEAKKPVSSDSKKPTSNYFGWLLKSVQKGDMSIDDDLKFTIEYHLRQNNINPVALLIEENKKDWKGVINEIHQKMNPLQADVATQGVAPSANDNNVIIPENSNPLPLDKDVSDKENTTKSIPDFDFSSITDFEEVKTKETPKPSSLMTDDLPTESQISKMNDLLSKKRKVKIR
jgi:DNA polymerase III epsilon subunit family exonuclease